MDQSRETEDKGQRSVAETSQVAYDKSNKLWIALSSLPKQSPVPSSNAFASLLQPQAKHEKATDEEWSKVERRKAKKARKTEERSEVPQNLH